MRRLKNSQGLMASDHYLADLPLKCKICPTAAEQCDKHTKREFCASPRHHLSSRGALCAAFIL